MWPNMVCDRRQSTATVHTAKSVLTALGTYGQKGGELSKLAFPTHWDLVRRAFPTQMRFSARARRCSLAPNNQLGPSTDKRSIFDSSYKSSDPCFVATGIPPGPSMIHGYGTVPPPRCLQDASAVLVAPRKSNTAAYSDGTPPCRRHDHHLGHGKPACLLQLPLSRHRSCSHEGSECHASYIHRLWSTASGLIAPMIPVQSIPILRAD